MLNDVVVCKKIKEGDVGTFEKIFRQYYTLLCMYACSITGRYDISEEVVQDVFYNIWKDRERISIQLSIKNYLYGAVRNHALRYLEHEQVQRQYEENILNNSLEAELSPQEELEYKELENVITNLLNKMPERRRQIFLMFRMKGKKQKEIAGFFAISIKTVEAEMSKAMQTIRQGIENYTNYYGFYR
jgi:RNA polymerase sigma-70 factor (ECF subfamily)